MRKVPGLKVQGASLQVHSFLGFGNTVFESLELREQKYNSQHKPVLSYPDRPGRDHGSSMVIQRYWKFAKIRGTLFWGPCNTDPLFI